MGGSGSSTGPTASTAEGADGVILKKGDRVQTQYTVAEGGDDRWYSGHVAQVYADNKIKIKYDDGDTWTGASIYARSLQASSGGVIRGQAVAGGAVQGQVVSGQVVSGGAVQGQVLSNNMADPTAPVVTGSVIVATAVARNMPQGMPAVMPDPELAIGDEPCCPVCTTNRMDMALTCGHRLCGGCLKSLQEFHASKGLPLCPLCQKPIEQVMRLYN